MVLKVNYIRGSYTEFGGSPQNENIFGKNAKIFVFEVLYKCSIKLVV